MDLLHAMRTYSGHPYASNSLHEPPILADCEKELEAHDDVYQANACLFASFNRRDAADAEFEVQVLALLGPVKRRLAEMASNGESVPAPHAPFAVRAAGADLPPAPQIFHGREPDLIALIAAFSQNCQAHTALLGQEGAGKSALALTLLHRPEMARKFGPRRFFIPCETSENAADVYSCLASALGAACTPWKVYVLSELASAPYDSLIVLDDLKPSAAIEELLAQLSGIPRVSLLLTLRDRWPPSGPIYTMPSLVLLGPLSFPSARALFTAISDIPSDAEVNGAPSLIDALLQHVGCLPGSVILLAQRAQYEPLPFLLARCAEEDGV